ncbi:Zinc ion binding protein [Phytophthora megakarya]|uniref:Zinc ion binding protein n=1 Tax=Phytophthora megakarya TaxID=4795 RepID=A0A225WM62_9STRA|nr:Zinc ion binding protein [Phytophthora megakarya]
MQCPNCGIGVTRIDGCNTMTCICGSHFSYLGV